MRYLRVDSSEMRAKWCLLVYMCGTSSFTCVGRWRDRDGRFPLINLQKCFRSADRLFLLVAMDLRQGAPWGYLNRLARG